MARETRFHIGDVSKGIARELAPGITARIFPGHQAMVSIVRLEPHAKGMRHQHPEEQWGFCIEGTATRYQGEESFPVAKGDVWLTPGGTPHTIEAGPEGCLVFDVFAPPREAYIRPGSGFGTDEG